MQDTTTERPEDVHVRLKPVFGIQPTTYLPGLYGFLIVLIVFLLLFLPGIVRPGTVFVVTSRPTHAAIAVDGAVLGATDGEVFVPSGLREITVSRPGFAPDRRTVEVPGRVFGSLFAPRRELLEIVLSPEDLDEHIVAVGEEFARWSLVGEASGQYQFPPVARELARDLAAAGTAADYAAFARRALMHVNSEAQLADLAAGSSLAASPGGATPLSIARTIQELSRAAADGVGLPVQLAGFLTGPRDTLVEESPWAATARAVIDATAGEPLPPSPSAGPVRAYEGIAFVQLPGGSGISGGTSRAEGGGDIPYRVSVEPILVSQTEIPVSAYARFTAEVPYWAPDNREDLVEAGLADGNYLRDWESGVPSATMPVRYVSAHAASAFAQWLTSRVASSGLLARLPVEAEWDYLAATDAPENGVFASQSREGPSAVQESGRGRAGLYGVAGNLWEWTDTTFARYARYYPSAAPLPSAYRVVRGGGWATPQADFTRDDRGAMPASWCSGAVGFRVVLVER